MSTSAESALVWLDESQPSIEQINNVIAKLEARILGADHDQDLTGTRDALTLLQQVVTDMAAEMHGQVPEELPPPSAGAALDTRALGVGPDAPSLDLSPLGDPATLTRENLSTEARRQRFEALKQQLSKKPL